MPYKERGDKARPRTKCPETPDGEQTPIAPPLPQHPHAMDIRAETYEEAAELLGNVILPDSSYEIRNKGTYREAWTESARAFLHVQRPHALQPKEIARLFYDHIRQLWEKRWPEDSLASNHLLRIEDILLLFQTFMHFEDASDIGSFVRAEVDRSFLLSLASLAHRIYYDDPATYPYEKFELDAVEIINEWQKNTQLRRK